MQLGMGIWKMSWVAIGQKLQSSLTDVRLSIPIVSFFMIVMTQVCFAKQDRSFATEVVV